MENLDVCFYHNPCSDGLGAAWAIRQKYPDISYIGINPSENDISDDIYFEKEIMFVDVCPSKSLLTKMLEHSKKVIILDHHKTNQAFVSTLSNDKLHIVFDMDRSGCQIAWDYVNPSTDQRPWFIDYIGDRDLWKFELPNSKLINLGLYELGYITFDKLDYLYEYDIYKNDLIHDVLLPTAKTIEAQHTKMINNAVKKAHKATFQTETEKYCVWIGTTLSNLKSEFGNTLVNTNFSDGTEPDFAVIYEYDFKSSKWWISLRSKKVDVAEISQLFGGGGHKFAAGFNTTEHIDTLFKYTE